MAAGRTTVLGVAADWLRENRPLPSKAIIVVSMIFGVIVGIAWSFGLLFAAWSACGGDFGGYGAAANAKLDEACQSRHSSTAWMPVVFVPLSTVVLLCVRRWYWRRSNP